MISCFPIHETEAMIKINVVFIQRNASFFIEIGYDLIRSNRSRSILGLLLILGEGE